MRSFPQTTWNLTSSSGLAVPPAGRVTPALTPCVPRRVLGSGRGDGHYHLCVYSLATLKSGMTRFTIHDSVVLGCVSSFVCRTGVALAPPPPMTWCARRSDLGPTPRPHHHSRLLGASQQPQRKD